MVSGKKGQGQGIFHHSFIHHHHWNTQEDSFGLRTLDEQGKIHFEGTEGDHLRFSEEELLELVVKYFE